MEIQIRFTIIILLVNFSLCSQNSDVSQKYIEDNLIYRGFNDITFLDKKNNTSYFHTQVASSDGEGMPIIIAMHNAKNSQPILNLIEDKEYTDKMKKYYPNRYDEATYHKYVNIKEEEEFLLALISSSKFSVLESDHLKMLGKNYIPIYHYVDNVFFEWDAKYHKVAHPLIISNLRHEYTKEEDSFQWHLEQLVTLRKVGIFQANSVNEALIFGRVLINEKESKQLRELAIKQKQNELDLSKFEFKDPTYWKRYASQEYLLRSIYNGDFDGIKNDINFKHLYTAYVYNLSYNCPSLLPDNKKEIILLYPTYRTVRNGILATGMKSMPFIDNYENQTSTKRIKVTLNPLFEEKFRLYDSGQRKSVASNIITSAILDGGNGTYLYESLIHIDNFLRNEECNKESLDQLGENIYRFSNGEMSLQQESRTKK